MITSVTRDDLPDGGASHFARAVTLLKERLPGIEVEVLTPDFRGDPSQLDIILQSRPDVFNHNVETVSRLYSTIRPQADYQRSLSVLSHASKSGLVREVKSGLMVGLGEYPLEVVETMKHLREHGCTIVTIGQYLQPSKEQQPVDSFVEPAQFDAYAKAGRELGLKQVFAGPLVRSSYNAAEIFRSCGPVETQP